MSAILGALIGAGLNIVANGIGTAIANKRKRAAEENYQQAINNEISDIDKEIGSNYLDSAEAQNAIRKATDANTETLRQLNTDAIRGGATDEAKVAMANKLTQNTAGLVGDIAAVGEQRKEALKGEKRKLKLGLAGHQYQQNSDTSGIDNILTGIGTAANTIASAWATKNTTPDTITTEGADANPVTITEGTAPNPTTTTGGAVPQALNTPKTTVIQPTPQASVMSVADNAQYIKSGELPNIDKDEQFAYGNGRKIY